MATFSTARHRREPRAAARHRSHAGHGAARVIGAIAAAIATVIVVGILLTVLEANRSNDVVALVLDAARWLVGPFKGLFDLDSQKLQVAVNWGLAAAVYLLIGRLVARLLAR